MPNQKMHENAAKEPFRFKVRSAQGFFKKRKQQKTNEGNILMVQINLKEGL